MIMNYDQDQKNDNENNKPHGFSIFSFIWKCILGYIAFLYGVLQAAILSESYRESSGAETGLLDPDSSLADNSLFVSLIESGLESMADSMKKNSSSAAVVCVALFAPYVGTSSGSSEGDSEVIEIIIRPAGTLDDDMPYDVVEKRAHNLYMFNKQLDVSDNCILKMDTVIYKNILDIIGNESSQKDVINRLKIIEKVLADECFEN